MPVVGGKHYPYTAKGQKAAKKARSAQKTSGRRPSRKVAKR